jgi:hypothetical protein
VTTQADSPILDLLRRLPDSLEYAIERNLDNLATPLVSDIDIIMRKRDFCHLLNEARRSGILISVALAYGGARLFVGHDANSLKRIDCMWTVHYSGIPLDNIGELLAARATDSNTGLSVLPVRAQARVVWTIKNAYGGAEKYRALLEQHGYAILTPRARSRWLAAIVLRQPLVALMGFMATMMAYLARLVRPTGVVVTGANPELLRRSRAITYLFQNRIRADLGIAATVLRARVLSEICTTRHAWLADVDLSGCDTLSGCENKIIEYLKSNRTSYGC